MKIEICDQCKGIGKRTESDRFDGYYTYTCPECNGTGRLKVLEYHFKKPFDTSDSVMNKVDNEIYKILRQ